MPTARLSTLISLISLAMFFDGAAHADDKVVNDVIASALKVIAYNPVNSTDEEIEKAILINSDLRLRHLLLHETTNTELKACIALTLLRHQIAEARRSKELGNVHLNSLLRQQAELVKVYRALHEPKTTDVEKKHATPQKLWQHNRITPDQPFPARVIGVSSSWVGYTLLLEEITDKKPRYCVADLQVSRLAYRIVADKRDFKGSSDNGHPATALSPGIDIEHFSWSIGVTPIGQRFGKDDFVAQRYSYWLKHASKTAN